MGRPSYGPSHNNSNRDLSEGFLEMLGGVSKVIAYLGGGASILSFGLLMWYAYSFTTGSPTPEATHQALSNILLAKTVLALGLIGFGVGTAYIWWGEPKLPITHAVVAVVVAGAPFYTPMALGTVKNIVPATAMQTAQTAGAVFVMIAAIVLIVDVGIRIKDRSAVGMKADQLKFGKGVKEELDLKVVFMGKCWQLPFCRKFVRERCPIYHSGRTCWKERVGCMCEEEVIRNALEGKTIPKEMLKSAKYIPRNNKLTLAQKAARCRQCVIYNEHQKQKYRLWLVITNVGCVGLSVLLWNPLLAGLNGALSGIDSVVKNVLVNSGDVKIHDMLNGQGMPFVPLLLACILLIGFTYALKLLEFLIFKAKI